MSQTISIIDWAGDHRSGNDCLPVRSQAFMTTDPAFTGGLGAEVRDRQIVTTGPEGLGTVEYAGHPATATSGRTATPGTLSWRPPIC